MRICLRRQEFIAARGGVAIGGTRSRAASRRDVNWHSPDRYGASRVAEAVVVSAFGGSGARARII